MGQDSSRESGHGKQGRHGRRHHGRRERSDIPSSSTQPVHNDHVSFGGICRDCNMEYDNFESHRKDCRRELTQLNLGPRVDTDQPKRPRYGKDMHPSNPNFSAQNTMTPSSFDSPQIPLDRGESEDAAPSSTSGSVPSSNTSQDRYWPTDVELGARAWEHVWPSKLRRDSQRSDAPSSERSASSSDSTVRAFSKKSFEELQRRCTSQAEQRHGVAASSPPLSPYENARAPVPPPPAQREYHHPPMSAPSLRVPQDDRGRERNRPGHYTSTRNSSRRSESRSHRDTEPRGSEHAHLRQHPPRSSENTTQRHRHQREPSTTRVSHQSEAQPSRSVRYDDFSARDSRRDGYVGHSTTERAPPGRAYVQQTERVVFPGDRSQFSPSYLQEMGDLRFGNPGRYNDREDRGEHYDDDDNSDVHMFTREQLLDMARTRGWKGSRRS